MAADIWRLLADAVLVAHVAIVAFVVGGLAAILAGHALGWAWVDRWGFRLAHLATIAVVAAEAWLGIVCPLTTWETALRERAGQGVYGGDFVAHWLQRLLFWQAPAWVFTALYSAFVAAVVATWWRFPPRARTASR